MDDITTRTIIIGVNIFVTIAIVSIIIVMFFQMQDIYKVVSSTDTSIYNKFDDVYSKYNGKTVTGVGLLNALKSYETNTETKIKIYYTDKEIIEKKLTDGGREVLVLKQEMENYKLGKKSYFKYEDKYNVTVTEENGEYVITFDKIKY